MNRKLADMTLEELWALFPIFLTEHRPCWDDWYRQERAYLQEDLPMERIARISHVGSTAIHGIWAKPIVDILVEVGNECDMEPVKEAAREAGYTLMNSGPMRFSFNKGYTPEGFAERVFHLHLRLRGDNDELYFRDYLNDRPDIAAAYEQLKLKLWPQYEHDRDGYTEHKTEFVKLHTQTARQLYSGRYD